MPRILVVRHGESTWNEDGRWQGQADPPLTDLGRRQAMVAAATLGVVDEIIASPLQRAFETATIAAATLGVVDEIIASPLQRAFETATIVAEQLGIGPVHAELRLQERNAGAWQGLTRVDIEAGWPGDLAAGRRPEGWEPDDDVLVRVSSALSEIGAAIGTGDALVFSHGGVIRALERALGAQSLSVPNLGGRWIGVDGTQLTLGERLILIDPDDVEVTIPGQI